jgi:glucokinase
MIIVGDIGGTKTNVALFADAGGPPGAPVAVRSYPSVGSASLEAVVGEFVREQRPERITRACFGVAGPVIAGRVQTPNLAWDVDSRVLARALGVESVTLINDLEATAYGLEALGPEQLHTLNDGEGGRPGHRGLIAAGTGLGMSALYWDGRRHHPMPSEGGHIDFAPRNEVEFALLTHLQHKIGGRVSYERILSGPGLENVYDFLRGEGRASETPRLSGEIDHAPDRAARISAAALSGESELAAKALDLFVEIYGAMAGNLALLLKAVGGIYVGGGIAPKNLAKLKDGTFMRAYLDKGRMSRLVASFPVHVILDDKTPLYGAALRATLAD